MPAELTLPADRVTLTLELGRRGIDVTCAGVVEIAEGAAFDDTALVMVLLDDVGAILVVERNSLRLEEAQAQRLVFSEYVRVPPAVAERIAAVEVWTGGALFEVTEVGRVELAAELPAPPPGGVTFHTVGGTTVRRPPPDEDGEVRLTTYGRCTFAPGARYDDRAAIRCTLRDADGAVVHTEDNRIETLGGLHGEALFDDYGRPHIAQLERATHLDLRIVAKRWVTSGRARIERAAFVLRQED